MLNFQEDPVRQSRIEITIVRWLVSEPPRLANLLTGVRSFGHHYPLAFAYDFFIPEGSKLSPDFDCNNFTNFSFNVPKTVSQKNSSKWKVFRNVTGWNASLVPKILLCSVDANSISNHLLHVHEVNSWYRRSLNNGCLDAYFQHALLGSVYPYHFCTSEAINFFFILQLEQSTFLQDLQAPQPVLRTICNNLRCHFSNDNFIQKKDKNSESLL